ncbi:acyltransferase LovD [Colletotrichum liriopes]|uniref:Acyltransferase LovD n=1 Tax=Colletotrichum liriopes TaxID=708192 RepID=A0AA37H079_9PEZI|nr:acyltransferase LovD [Colletotrichum liriopes]
MIWGRFLALGTLVLGVGALPASLQDFDSTNNSCENTPHVALQLHNVFSTAVREKRVPGIAAVALNRDGSVIFKSAWGTIDINDPLSDPINSSTKMPIASMTKAVTAVAALQLIEQGKLGLEDLVADHIPAWKSISVLDGFTGNGQPILRAPKSNATILNLFTHTSGQPYAFLNHNIRQWGEWVGNQSGTPPPTPLAADPGTGWFYGDGLDTLGKVIESISGLRLDTYFEKHIFKPLGIKNSGLIAADIYSHRRLVNGTITASAPSPVSPNATPGGGAFLTSTLDDYSNFLLSLLNWGTHPQTGATILKSSTVKNYVFTDLLRRAVPGYGTCGFKPAGDPVGVWNSNDETLSRNYTFLPGTRKGWSASFLTNNENVPERRKEGSGAWAGINNLFYWIDPKSGKLGIIFTNLLPFLDPEILDLFDKLEEEVSAL